MEPKHRDKLGIRIWLYLYILDQADWDTGEVLEWRDGDAADGLQMPKRTVRQQRQQPIQMTIFTAIITECYYFIISLTTCFCLLYIISYIGLSNIHFHLNILL